MAAGIFRQRKGALSMKRYGYHRTSTREQHLDRGIKEITAYCEQNGLELEKISHRPDRQELYNHVRPHSFNGYLTPYQARIA